MTRTRLAWTITGLDVVAIVGVGLVSPTLGLAGALTFMFGITSFAAVGALLMTRVPTNPIGRLLLTAGTLLAAAMVAGAYADIGDVQAPPWVGSDVARVIQTALFVLPFFIALIGVPLVFPDGHLPSRRFALVVGSTIAAMATWPVATFLRALLAGELGANVADPEPLTRLVGGAEAVFFVATSVSFAASALAIALRFRRGGPVEREQIKWLLAVAGLAAAILPLSFVVAGESNPVVAEVLTNLVVLTLFALPIVIAIAILRYRLYEIDRIISRTISWGIVSAVLVAAFWSGLLIMQAALSGITQGQTLAVAASTLLTFALFQPLRLRVQGAVDRRFFRAQYDAGRAADNLARRLRAEVDLDTIRRDVAGTVVETMQPLATSLWIRRAGG
jgi:hypothetical protein